MINRRKLFGWLAALSALPLVKPAVAISPMLDMTECYWFKRTSATGTAYARALKIGALCEADGALQDACEVFVGHYSNDPAGYLKAAHAYREHVARQLTLAAGPDVGEALINIAVPSHATLTTQLQARRLRLRALKAG